MFFRSSPGDFKIQPEIRTIELLEILTRILLFVLVWNHFKMSLIPKDGILKNYMCVHTHTHTHKTYCIFEQLHYVLGYVEPLFMKPDTLKSFKGIYRRVAICHVLEHHSFLKMNYFCCYLQILSI